MGDLGIHLRDCLLLPFSCGHGGTRRGHFKIGLGKNSGAGVCGIYMDI